ncbi:ABC transporter permease [Endozoicomonas sp. G2_2]|uniref:ABC transporter permease n=1 Tax=Gammaproteobacteria TaxID=1236 RepID=UPI000C421111|nr:MULTISPECIES: ABC transporter permease [Gammaproteobacteria]MAS10644.1 amino acid ABC transporter permease [Salinisphaera sp.]MBO9471299.1 ABC transporter permease [Endozoicomonas sp. G2_2]|tara:strand:- start:750 stop:1478 length:729 start_codon:yes stop_codon:yes gene_type:complete
MEQWLAHVAPWLSANDIFTPATLARYWTGLVNTVDLVFVSLIIGLMMAVPLAIVRSSRRWWLSGPVWVYTYIFRGTPLLIQLYLAYYGFAFVPGVQDSWLWFFIEDPVYPALFAFTLNTAAYTTEIFHGAIRATPRGELEAARAYGMSSARAYRRIVLPSAFRRALPAYGNEVIFMLHASAIASAVTIMDLTGAAYFVYARFYTPFPAFICVALIYMGLTFAILAVFRTLERRLLRHRQPAA